ncbi:MAG TPA: DUF2997 domain-containing protein [Myxococcota bacterium]|nr:DUF2997 domain-containing protein [Myxococcota bacterium]HQK50008.1 DUF2997 domain-containing protein [Myxococcota bacterium]
MGHQIDIEIRPDGTFTFGVKGVKGRSCKEVTKFLEELGALVAQENTGEYYQEEVQETATAQEHVRVGKK